MGSGKTVSCVFAEDQLRKCFAVLATYFRRQWAFGGSISSCVVVAVEESLGKFT